MRQERDRSPGARKKPGRTYQPPKVNKVPIRIDEVMLSACKTGGGMGGGAATCITGCVINGS